MTESHHINSEYESDTDKHTHTHLLQEAHEARRRHHTDFSHQCLCYCSASLLLAAAFRVRLQWGDNYVTVESARQYKCLKVKIFSA